MAYYNIEEGGHAGAVVLHALDGQGEEGAAAVIGGVAQDIHGEDDVVRRQYGCAGRGSCASESRSTEAVAFGL